MSQYRDLKEIIITRIPMEQTPTFSIMKLVKMISQNICFCIPRLQQYTVSRLHSVSTKKRFWLRISHNQSTGELFFFTHFPAQKSKPVLKHSLVSIIKLMWVAAELINHMGCNKSTPIPVLGRSYDLTPWIIPLSAGTAQVEVSSRILWALLSRAPLLDAGKWFSPRSGGVPALV